MLHRPENIKEILGNIEVMAKLYEAWNKLTQLYTIDLEIFKSDSGMDRDREMLIHRAKEKIPEMRNLVEKVINLYKKDMELIQFKDFYNPFKTDGMDVP